MILKLMLNFKPVNYSIKLGCTIKRLKDQSLKDFKCLGRNVEEHNLLVTHPIWTENWSMNISHLCPQVKKRLPEMALESKNSVWNEREKGMSVLARSA